MIYRGYNYDFQWLLIHFQSLLSSLMCEIYIVAAAIVFGVELFMRAEA